MEKIQKHIRVILNYFPCGYGYGDETKGFIALTVNYSNAKKYSKAIEKDMSIRQLAQYIEKCMEEENNEG